MMRLWYECTVTEFLQFVYKKEPPKAGARGTCVEGHEGDDTMYIADDDDWFSCVYEGCCFFLGGGSIDLLDLIAAWTDTADVLAG